MTRKKSSNKSKQKGGFIFDKTITSSIRKNELMPNYPKEVRKGKISKFKVEVKRGEKLNYYGNPVYSVNVTDTKTGKTGYSKSTYLNGAISTAIRKTGCKVKY